MPLTYKQNFKHSKLLAMGDSIKK